MEKSAEKNVKIEIKVDENTAAGHFVNFSNISSSAEEFVFDFVFMHPTPPPGFGKLMSRVICTPAHAKRFAGALQESIRQYENKFGEIKIMTQQRSPGNLQ